MNNKLIAMKIAVSMVLSPLLILPALYYLVFNLSFIISKILIWLIGYIPQDLISINFPQNINITDFLAYYISVLGIEVTGLLSFMLYKLTREQYEKSKKEDQIQLIVSLKEVLEELEKNFEMYVGKGYPNGEKYNFNKYLEKDNNLLQWGYSNMRFKTLRWNQENIRIIYECGGYFGTKINSVYDIFKYINDNNDIKDLDKSKFQGFNESLKILMIDIKNFIGDAESNKIYFNNLH